MNIIKVLLALLILLQITRISITQSNELPSYTKSVVIEIQDYPRDCKYETESFSLTIDKCQQYHLGQWLLVTGSTPRWAELGKVQPIPIQELTIKPISSSVAIQHRVTLAIIRNQERFRASLLDMLASAMPEEYATFSLLLVFGGSLSQFSDATKESILASGLAHVVAASGMNVAFVLVLARVWSSQHRVCQVVYSSGLVIGYAVLAGWNPPVVRAALGASLLVMGRRLWLRPASPLRLLIASAALQLIFSPQLLTSLSFQLSYAASFGILALFPALANTNRSRTTTRLRIGKSKQGDANRNLITSLTQYIKTTLLVSICCWVMVAPILAYSFNTFSLTAIVSGLLTTWMVPLLFGLSLISMIAASLLSLAPSLSLLVGLLLQPLQQLDSVFFAIARTVADLSFLQWSWSPGWWQVLVWYGVVLGLWWWLGRIGRTRLPVTLNIQGKPRNVETVVSPSVGDSNSL